MTAVGMIFTFSSRQAALYGTLLFALLSVFAAHFARPVARNLHVVFTTVVIVVFGVLLIRSGEVDVGGALTRMLVDVVVVFADLDNAKQINDTHGHDVGDAVLCLAAQRLAVVVDDRSTSSR